MTKTLSKKQKEKEVKEAIKFLDHLNKEEIVWKKVPWYDELVLLFSPVGPSQEWQAENHKLIDGRLYQKVIKNKS